MPYAAEARLIVRSMTDSLFQVPPQYESFLQELTERIRSAQVRAALSVNRELIQLYWSIGRNILNRQNNEGWGAKVIDRLSDDLSRRFRKCAVFGPGT